MSVTATLYQTLNLIDASKGVYYYTLEWVAVGDASAGTINISSTLANLSSLTSNDRLILKSFSCLSDDNTSGASLAVYSTAFTALQDGYTALGHPIPIYVSASGNLIGPDKSGYYSVPLSQKGGYELPCDFGKPTGRPAVAIYGGWINNVNTKAYICDLNFILVRPPI